MMQHSPQLLKELQQLQQEMGSLNLLITTASSTTPSWWQGKKREKIIKQRIQHLRNKLQQDLIA